MMIDPETAVYLVLEWSLITLAVVVFYAFVTFRLRRLSQPLRLQFAYDAEKLLSSGRLPEREAHSLRYMLDNAFNGWLPWAMIPGFAIFLVADLLGLSKKKQASRIEDAELRDQVGRAYRNWILAICGLSPIAGLLVLSELLLAGLLIKQVREWRALRSAIGYLGNRVGASYGSHLARG